MQSNKILTFSKYFWKSMFDLCMFEVPAFIEIIELLNNFIPLVSFYTHCKHQKTKTISKNVIKQSLETWKASKCRNFKHSRLQTKQFLKASNKMRFRFWYFFSLFWIFGLTNDLFQEKRFWKKNVSYTKIPALGNHKLTFWIKKKKQFNSFMTEVWKKKQSNNLLCKSMDRFLCDSDFPHERIK